MGQGVSLKYENAEDVSGSTYQARMNTAFSTATDLQNSIIDRAIHTHLNFTNNGFFTVVKKTEEIAPRWVALGGGGGYSVANVAKAWTYAWAIMNDCSIPDELPEDFLTFILMRVLKAEGSVRNHIL